MNDGANGDIEILEGLHPPQHPVRKDETTS